MTCSMTAFTRQQSEHDWGLLAWEIRSVNHRYLEPSLRLPDIKAIAEIAHERGVAVVMVPGLAISLVLIFLARPIAVFIALIPFRMALNRKVLISWVGLRGAVPIIFATFPLTAGIENGALIFHIVFFTVITSVALQGTTIPLMARWLRLERIAPPKRPSPQELELTTELHGELHELVVTDESPAVGSRLVRLHFPPGVVITMIHRDGVHLVPNGNTRIDANDRLLVLCPDGRTLQELIDRLKLIDLS